MIELHDTNASQIAAEFVRARRGSGSPAMGMVMTLVIVVPEEHALVAFNSARLASQEHPARVLGVILGDGRGHGQISAQVGIGDGRSGETALIRLKGEVVRHAASVVLPLLLPDSPVAVWWPVDPPQEPATDPLGALAQRRITDSAAVTKGKTVALQHQCSGYAPGNTDLAWTRLTPWRAMLAAAMDQRPFPVTGAHVVGERISPSADLMVGWLTDRLGVEVRRSSSEGPGITEVTLTGKRETISLARADGQTAVLSVTGAPDRQVALPRRPVEELLAEELRHLDEDEPYAEAAATLLALTGQKEH